MNEQCYYRVSVKGLVYDNTGRILLARESNGLWELLGGGLDHDEDPIACLKREIYEETGLTVTNISSRPKYFITAPRQDHETYIANIKYEVELASLEFTPSEECQELRFVSLEEMSGLFLYPNVKKFQEILLNQART
jgi:8-oxo-dGTP pyrophosphatase MutT (NUDIX family)